MVFSPFFVGRDNSIVITSVHKSHFTQLLFQFEIIARFIVARYVLMAKISNIDSGAIFVNTCVKWP